MARSKSIPESQRIGRAFSGRLRTADANAIRRYRVFDRQRKAGQQACARSPLLDAMLDANRLDFQDAKRARDPAGMIREAMGAAHIMGPLLRR
jgi:hypothetical protein